MKFFVALFLVLAAAAQAKTTNDTGFFKKVFVGCRPSAGECKYSCPTRRGIAEIDRTKCDPNDWHERLACYCIVRPGERFPKFR